MSHSIFERPELLVEYYRAQVDTCLDLKGRIWRQIEHYTWFLSIVLCATPVSLATQTEFSRRMVGLILALPVVGTAIAVIAFLIIRTDLGYMAECDSRLLYLERELGVTDRAEYLDRRLERARSAGFSVAANARRQSAIRWLSLRPVRIRKLILWSFVIYVFAGVAEIVYVSWFVATLPPAP